MPAKSFRVVIQRVLSEPKIAYRLIAYGDDAKPAHAYYDDIESLLNALRSAAIAVDEGTIRAGELDPGGPSVMFSGELDLDESQRRMLGLIPAGRHNPAQSQNPA